MPLYEYKCRECGLRFERRQRFSEDPVSTCPECKGAVKRLIQPIGIIFKGSGFYVTDNRAKSSTRIPTKSEKETEKGKDKEKKSSSAETSSTNKTESSRPDKKG